MNDLLGNPVWVDIMTGSRAQVWETVREPAWNGAWIQVQQLVKHQLIEELSHE